MRLRWAALGAALGVVLTLVCFAPAAWLAAKVNGATGERLMLADARGTVWNGSAVLVLTGGAGSRDASALPGRLQWRLGLDGAALALRLRQDCCLHDEVTLRLRPGVGRLALELPAPAAAKSDAPNAVTAGAAGGPPPGIVSAPAGGAIGTWPASWLAGLGTPWNTLQPAGALQLRSPGLIFEQVQGRWRFTGQAQIDLLSMSSRLSTLAVLGDYRVTLNGGETATVQLSTLAGALQMQGSGSFLGDGPASRLRFSGQASAAPGSEQVLSNLLNLIGRRQGAVSVISIG